MCELRSRPGAPGVPALELPRSAVGESNGGVLLRQIRALRKAGDAGAPMQAWMKKDEMVALAQRR